MKTQVKSETVAEVYRIESKWPAWSKWRTVTPAPHSEQNLFDAHGIFFISLQEAERACANLQTWNVGEFRVILPCGCPAENRDICTHGGNGRLA